jgi:uncharacterized membrane protein YqhA
MRKLFSASRYIILVPVAAILVGAIVLIVVGTISVINEIFILSTQEMSAKAIKQATLDFITAVDVFLLATVMYIIGVGLYELFIGPLDLPEWLAIKDLDDLKAQLVSVIIAVLAVLFLGFVIGWDGASPGLLISGGAIGLIIVALTFFLNYKTTKGGSKVTEIRLPSLKSNNDEAQ